MYDSLDEAIAVEREACAKIAEEFDSGDTSIGALIAELIRNRQNKPVTVQQETQEAAKRGFNS